VADTKNCLYKEKVSSGLGDFELRIESTGELVSIESESPLVSIESTSHRITIKCVAAPTDWLTDGMKVDWAKAWLLYVTKQTDQEEMLTVSLKLPDISAATQAGSNTGQFLTAIEFEDGDRQIHLGTPDEEWFALYAKQTWMPTRLKESLFSNELIITSIEANGLVSSVPELQLREQFYLHYVLAESPRHKSKDYPDEWDVSTWYAVDQSQKTLEDTWLQQANTSG
jgi:hypothetical protein